MAARSQCSGIVAIRSQLPIRPSPRFLSTSPSRHAVKPESPRYLDVPETVQPTTRPLPWMKGVLPVPRDVLPKHKEYKASSRYLAAATPEPKTQKARHDDREASRLAYKERMSDSRRRNLRQGLTELMERKVQTRTAIRRRQQIKIEESRRALLAPERKDERLTRQSLPLSVRQALERKSSSPTKPRRPENFQAHAERMRKIKMDQIHNLYLHAKDFIVNEEQLEGEIERVFGTDDSPVRWNEVSSGLSGLSVWAAANLKSTSELVRLVDSPDYLRYAMDQDAVDPLEERMKRISEEILGGRQSVKRAN